MPVGEVLRRTLDQLGLVLVPAEIDGPLDGHMELAGAVVAQDKDRQQRSAGELCQAGRAAGHFQGGGTDACLDQQLALPGSGGYRNELVVAKQPPGLVHAGRGIAAVDDNPARINNFETELKKVTPALMQKTAQEYLRPENRTILAVQTKEAK